EALGGVPLAALDVAGDLRVEEDSDPCGLAADEAKGTFGELLRAVVGGVVKPVTLEPVDRAEAIESEGADLAMVGGEGGEVEAFLVDHQRVGLDDEGLAPASDAFVGHAKALLTKQRGDDVIHILEAALVEVARLIHVEHLAIEVPDGCEVLPPERGLEFRE